LKGKPERDLGWTFIEKEALVNKKINCCARFLSELRVHPVIHEQVLIFLSSPAYSPVTLPAEHYLFPPEREGTWA